MVLRVNTEEREIGREGNYIMTRYELDMVNDTAVTVITETRNLRALPFTITEDQDPVVQSIVSLTISLRHKFVKQISAKVTIHCYFLLKKCKNPLQCKGFSHFFNKKITVYMYL